MNVAWKRLFWNDDDGTILAEALLVIPVVTIFAVGILEFGNVFWQRHLLEVAVRDAARYWARCKPTFMPCTEAIATNIALFGNPAGDGLLRVPNWDGTDSLTFDPAVPVANPSASDTVLVIGEMTYYPSPLFGMLNIGDVTITYSHQERYYGW